MKIKDETSNWSAWYNVQPGQQQTLHVTGQIDVGNQFVGAVLNFETIEKSNPPNLVLRIAEKTIFIPRNPDDHIVHLHYQEQARVGTYGAIKIILGDDIVKEFQGSDIGIAH